MTAHDVLSHVKNSTTYRALELETRVAAVLRRHVWTSTHGAYYVDVKTGVDREFDVVGTRTWRRERKRQRSTFIRLHLLAECKSVLGGNVLVAEHPGPSRADRLYYQWIGVQRGDLQAASLEEVLASSGVSDPKRVVQSFATAVYPEGRISIMPFLANPPRPRMRGSSGRETKGARAEGNFLWSATQEVFSALAGTTASLLQLSFDELRDRLGSGEDDPLEALLDEATTVNLFHPIVVTDAQLWRMADEQPLEPAPWCRLDQEQIATGANRWIDVVHADSFEDFSNELTRWYGSWFSKLKCEEHVPA